MVQTENRLKANDQEQAFIWKNTGIRLQVIDQLRMLAEQYGLSLLILFGSRARGDFRRDSDIDLAASGGDVALFRLAAEEETDTLLQYDVLDLNALIETVIREYIPAFQKLEESIKNRYAAQLRSALI